MYIYARNLIFRLEYQQKLPNLNVNKNELACGSTSDGFMDGSFDPQPYVDNMDRGRVV